MSAGFLANSRPVTLRLDRPHFVSTPMVELVATTQRALLTAEFIIEPKGDFPGLFETEGFWLYSLYSNTWVQIGDAWKCEEPGKVRQDSRAGIEIITFGKMRVDAIINDLILYQKYFFKLNLRLLSAKQICHLNGNISVNNLGQIIAATI
jgi:hypothetical protein